MSADRETIGVYDARAGDYARLVDDAKPSAHLTRFLDRLTPGARVLDLGCGPGGSAAQMRDLGFEVAAWDASPEMARLGHDAHGLQIRLAGFDDLTEKAAFDGIWANFSLLHAPKAEMPRHLAAVHRALRADGWLSLGLKTGEGEKRDALGRFYAYYTDAEITGLLRDAGFTVVNRATGEEPGLDGTVAPWIVLLAHG